MKIISEINYQAGRIARCRELAAKFRGVKFNELWAHVPKGRDRRTKVALLWHNIKAARLLASQLPARPVRRNPEGKLELCFIWDGGVTARPVRASVEWREVTPRFGQSAYAPAVLPLP